MCSNVADEAVVAQRQMQAPLRMAETKADAAVSDSDVSHRVAFMPSVTDRGGQSRDIMRDGYDTLP